MAISNHERVGKALDFLRDGLAPFVERELKHKYEEQWAFEVKEVLSDTRLGAGKGSALKDSAALLVVMDRKWNDVFRRTLGKAERSLVNELIDVRNRWAHQEPFTGNDAYRALDSVGRIALPDWMAERVGITPGGVAVLNGMWDRFQVWNTERYDETRGAVRAVAAAAFRKLI